MQVIKAGYEILDTLNGEEILKKIEKIARVCYKSEDLIGEGTAEKMVRALIKRGHEAMLEHFSFSVKFIVDRGVSHEIVRHRVASFAQESTRYCNYGSKGGEITVIEPCYFNVDGVNLSVDNWSERYGAWVSACMEAEKSYLRILADGATPQEARAVLPTSLKTEVVMTANLREIRHFLALRAVGITGKPHPQMLEVAVPLLKELHEKIPVVFDDLWEAYLNGNKC
jgi:thymidylate synthase (FAD)